MSSEEVELEFFLVAVGSVYIDGLAASDGAEFTFEVPGETI